MLSAAGRDCSRLVGWSQNGAPPGTNLAGQKHKERKHSANQREASLVAAQTRT